MMRIIRYLLGVMFLAMAISGCVQSQENGDLENRDVLFQTSTIGALSKGVYDGEMTYRELEEHGDFGIGTFNGLNGEMIGLEGDFYQIGTDGKANPVEGSMKTPFAAVTFFEPDKTVSSSRTMNYERLEKYLDNLLPTKNIFYAIKIKGTFKYIKTRSVPKQSKPYPPLAEVVEKQRTFEFRNEKGIIAGFWCPSYVEGVNVAGYHFHFITEEEKAGGHLLECQTQNAKIEIDNTPSFFMSLPKDREFYRTDLENKNGKD